MYYIKSKKLWAEKVKDGDVCRVITSKEKNKLKQKIFDYVEREKKGLLFETVADKWFEEHSGEVSEGTLKMYRPAKKRAIKYFKEIYIKDISPTDIQKLLLSLKLKEKTIRNQLSLLRQIFKYSVIKGYIESNPATELSTPKNLGKTKILPPDSEDIKRVKKYIDLDMGLFAFMGLYTGMRKGEMLALEWSDIDLDKKEITVNKSIAYKGQKPYLKTPKTENGIRIIPIINALYDELKKRKDEGIVFPSTRDGYIPEAQYERRWEKYQENSGTHFNAHQLRHAYATMLVENNIDMADAKYLLGHAQISTTIDIYATIRRKYVDKIAEKIKDIDIE